MDFRLGTIIPFIGEETDTRRGVSMPKVILWDNSQAVYELRSTDSRAAFRLLFFFFRLKEASRFRSSVKLYKGDQRTVKRKFPWFTDLVGFSSAIHDWADPI